VRSFLASLRTLVLPFNATSGRRIILDGVNGVIELYRSDDTLALRIGGPPPFLEDAVQFATGDPDESGLGNITSGISGAGGSRNMFLQVLAPSFNGAVDFPAIQVRSASQDGTTDPPEVRIEHDGPEGRLRIATVIGEAVLVAGTVAVARTSILATSRLYLSRRVAAGVPGFLSYVLNPGVGFTINSTAAGDTSTVEWLHLDE